MRVDDVMRHADADLALERGVGQAQQRLVVQVDHAAGVLGQQFPLGRQRQLALHTVEKRRSKAFLKPLDLHRDRRLGEVEKPGGAGDAPHFRDGDKRAQRGEVEIAGHRSNSVMIMRIFLHF